MNEDRSEIRRKLVERKIDPQEAMDKMNKIIEDTKIDIKLDEFKDIFEENNQVMG